MYQNVEGRTVLVQVEYYTTLGYCFRRSVIKVCFLCTKLQILKLIEDFKPFSIKKQPDYKITLTFKFTQLLLYIEI